MLIALCTQCVKDNNRKSLRTNTENCPNSFNRIEATNKREMLVKRLFTFVWIHFYWEFEILKNLNYRSGFRTNHYSTNRLTSGLPCENIQKNLGTKPVPIERVFNPEHFDMRLQTMHLMVPELLVQCFQWLFQFC